MKKVIKLILLLGIISALSWLFGLFIFIASMPKTIENPIQQTDGIVILTGGSERVGKGLDLLVEGRAQRLLISGVGKNTNYKDVLQASGNMPADILNLVDQIDLGYEAQNTRGNAEEIAKWVEGNNFRSIRVVTANYHMPRSLLELKERMPNLEIIMHPVFPDNIKIEEWWKTEGTKKLLILEYNKYILAKVLYLFTH